MTELSTKQQYLILVATSLGVLMSPLLASMIILGLPAIGSEFLVSARDLGWINTAYVLANVIFLVPASWFVNRIGYKKSFIIGTAILAATAFLAAVSPNYAVLLASRALSGIGVAFLVITGIAIITRVFPPDKRGFAIAINTTMVYIGGTVGPALGGTLTELFGWRSPFLLIIPLVLLSGILLSLFMKTEFTVPVRKFDGIGAVLYALAMFALVFGITTITDSGSLLIAGIGLLLFIVFIWYEMRKENPLLRVRLFAENKRFARSSYAALLNYAAIYAVTYMVSLYLQSVGQLSAAETGFILLFQPLVQAIATPAVGKFSGKVDAKYLTTAGMVLTIIGLLLLSGLGLSMTNVALYIIIAQVFTAFGVSLFSAPNTTTIMSSVKPEEYSMASSLVSVFRMAGMLLSMAVCMTVISVIVGSTALLGPAVYAEFTAALRISMLISVSLSFVGLFFSWFRGPAPNQQ